MSHEEALAALLNDYRNRADLGDLTDQVAVRHNPALAEQAAQYRGAVQALSEAYALLYQSVPPCA